MEPKYKTHLILGVIMLLISPPFFPGADLWANEDSKYLDAVREFADNVLKYGRDTYGPKHTPLFVDGLNVNTHEPVKWISPKGDVLQATEYNEWIISNFASQQTLLRTLDGLSKVTGDPKYRDAAIQAIKYAFDHLRTPSGLFYWGQVTAYDALGDIVRGDRTRESIKAHYPYYELMWKVDSEATKNLIGALWRAHIVDWSNLDLNRIGLTVAAQQQPWEHEYDEDGPTFFRGKSGGSGGGFFSTGTSLAQAGTMLHRLSGQEQPLVWSKRLIRRYVETRHPNTGISAFIYNSHWSLSGEDFKEHFADPYTTLFPLVPFEEGRGLYSPQNQQALPWISLFLVGDMLGETGKQFIQWALEELTAWGKESYRKEDNFFIPILTDGTKIEGYVCRENSCDAPRGSVAKPLFADLTFFWAYSIAYRTTGDAFAWQMICDIARGNDFGDLGEPSIQMGSLQVDISSADVYGLLGFLELFRGTKNPKFLEMARRIGDNIIEDKLYKGFFVPGKKHIYTKFDCFEPLALLHLAAVNSHRSEFVPEVWPSHPLFVLPYRNKQEGVDYRIIYTLTESTEPPLSLQEAAAIGDIDLVRSLLDKGVDVDSWDDSLKKTALQRAAMSGHIKVVALLLQKGVRIDAQDDWPGGTALIYASENGYKEVVKLLLEHGADANAKRVYPADDTSLHSATREGHKDIVELLIAKGADVSVKNSQGQTPLDIAIDKGHKDIVKLLLDNGAEYSSIHIAAQAGDRDQVKAFLDQGIDIDVKNEQGSTALFLAVGGKHEDIVKLLVAKGADVNAKDKWGYTPLCYTIWNADKDLTGFLISKGADVNLTIEKDYPPIYYAVWNKDLDTVKLLVAKGAKFDVKVLDDRTAFHYAVSQGSKDIVEFFVKEGIDFSKLYLSACTGDLAGIKEIVEQGADVNSKDELGWTPLCWAASMGQEEVAEFLLGKGAQVDTKTKDECSPLHQAAYSGTVRLIKLLVSKGADVNAKDKRGNTPLFGAASAGHSEAVELLIAKGADVNAKTQNNWTPLHRAAVGGHKDVVEILIAHGADVTVKDSRSRTPLDLAKQRGHTEIVELLRKHEAQE